MEHEGCCGSAGLLQFGCLEIEDSGAGGGGGGEYSLGVGLRMRRWGRGRGMPGCCRHWQSGGMLLCLILMSRSSISVDSWMRREINRIKSAPGLNTPGALRTAKGLNCTNY